MAHSFLKGTKLHVWLSHPDCPAAIKECKVLLDQAYSTRYDNYGAVDPFQEEPTPPTTARARTLPLDLCKLAGQHMALLQADIRHNGIVYSQSSTNISNSQIMFYPDGNRLAAGVPGIIKYIYEADGMMLYPARLSEMLEYVKVSWVIGHYANWPVSPDEVVVLSLCWNVADSARRAEVVKEDEAIANGGGGESYGTKEADEGKARFGVPEHEDHFRFRRDALSGRGARVFEARLQFENGTSLKDTEPIVLKLSWSD
ncbi:hypothetical protein EDD16DRAFT_1902169, partial [Pisolithus croceorrhizus]